MLVVKIISAYYGVDFRMNSGKKAIKSTVKSTACMPSFIIIIIITRLIAQVKSFTE